MPIRIYIRLFFRLGNFRRHHFSRLFGRCFSNRYRLGGDVGFFQNIHSRNSQLPGLYSINVPRKAGRARVSARLLNCPTQNTGVGAVETIAAVLPHIPFMQPNDDAAAYAQSFASSSPPAPPKSMRNARVCRARWRSGGIAHWGCW